jgi:hypothetical protein
VGRGLDAGRGALVTDVQKNHFPKIYSENRKAARWAALFKEANGEGKNLSGEAMQDEALTYARTDQ